MILSLLTPTRGRVDKCRRYLESVADTAEAPDRIETLFYVDADDPDRDRYVDMVNGFDHRKLGRCEVIVGNQITVSKAWNELALHSFNGSTLCMGNDDLVYTTKGWDTRLREEAARFGSDIWCAWFYDGIVTSKSWPTFPMISRKYYETVGYFAPDAGFKFFYNDTWVGEVSQMARCQIFIETPQYMKHLHHTRYPEETDATTRLPGKAGAERNDTDLFGRTVTVRQADARKLREAIAGDRRTRAGQGPELKAQQGA